MSHPVQSEASPKSSLTHILARALVHVGGGDSRSVRTAGATWVQ